MGWPSLSVDRLGHVRDDEVARIAEEELPEGQKLCGWAVVTVLVAQRNGRSVAASPTARNPYHADICLPEELEDDRDDLAEHANELAGNAEWREFREP